MAHAVNDTAPSKIYTRCRKLLSKTVYRKEEAMNSLSFTTSDYLSRRGGQFSQLAWWAFFLICLVYSAYAFFMAGVDVVFRLSITTEAPHRAVPPIFIIHAVTGGVVLISGSLQFNQRILTQKRKMHRVLGRIYVGSIWISSIGGLWSTLFFDVSFAAKFALGILAVLWFSTTTIALIRIRNREVAQHREWMMRSFALSFFFVTFSLWVPGLASTALPETIGYPLAVFLSWSVNLAIAEWWIHQTRPKFVRSQARGEL